MLPAVLALATLAVGHGGGPTPEMKPVHIGFNGFAPARMDVLTGDRVRWTSNSLLPHTVTAVDGSFDSGRLTVGGSHVEAYATAGRHPYLCRLHAGMRGEVDAHDLLLTPPGDAAGPHRPFSLSGRAALPEGTRVTILAEDGHVAGTTSVDAAGRFAATIVPMATSSYRAVADGIASPPVTVPVLDRTVMMRAHRRPRTTVVRVRVSPPAPRGRIVVQQRLRERSGWRPAARVRLDRGSRARVVLRDRRQPPVRAVLTLPDWTTALAVSRTQRFPIARGR